MVVRSSVIQARRLSVRSGLVVIATRLGCTRSPCSVQTGDDDLAEGILSSVVGVLVAWSSLWAGLLDSWWGCVGGLVVVVGGAGEL